jgi:hypothetical protein
MTTSGSFFERSIRPLATTSARVLILDQADRDIEV